MRCAGKNGGIHIVMWAETLVLLNLRGELLVVCHFRVIKLSGCFVEEDAVNCKRGIAAGSRPIGIGGNIALNSGYGSASVACRDIADDGHVGVCRELGDCLAPVGIWECIPARTAARVNDDSEFHIGVVGGAVEVWSVHLS